jgi:protoporphyrin/coproporphyrin ferrochelatase
VVVFCLSPIHGKENDKDTEAQRTHREEELKRMYDAILIVSFGGPEGMEDVLPFLQNVLRGRNVPQERMLGVAKHYEMFGGVSPINAQNRQLIAALKEELRSNGPDLPIYWGNRNWHPLLTEAMLEMKNDGIKRALAFVTSAYSSYSSCRQYRENIAAAQEAAGPSAPHVDKLRAFYNHPLFVQANVSNIRAALQQIDERRRPEAVILFTAHSIPESMAAGCNYAAQLYEVSTIITRELGHSRFKLVYQSRSDSPQPWLGPDVCDEIRVLKQEGMKDVVIAPVGFVSDHMEIIYDLDTEAFQLCNELGINMVRAATAGTHPLFVRMIRDLVVERINGATERQFVGKLGPVPDVCAQDCCPSNVGD